MNKILPNLICCLIPSKKIRHLIRQKFITPPYHNRTYSLYGEDRVLLSLLIDDNIDPKDVFFIDIGCYDPIEYNNTFLFYDCFGSNGINIDCNPQMIENFNKVRNRDINIMATLSDKDDKNLTYYMYEKGKSACNTFDKNLVDKRNYKPIKEVKLKTTTLNTVLKQYEKTTEDKKIILDIDIEGCEYEVLKNFNFNNYNILYILVEELDTNKEGKGKKLEQLLIDNGFKEVSKCNITKIFKKIK